MYKNQKNMSVQYSIPVSSPVFVPSIIDLSQSLEVIKAENFFIEPLSNQLLQFLM